MLGLATPAIGLTWTLPADWHWQLTEKGKQTIDFSVQKNKRLRLISIERNADNTIKTLTRFEGAYKMTAQKFSSMHVTFSLKTIFVGGKAHLGRSLDRRKRGVLFGQKSKVGDKISLTFNRGCTGSNDWLQLCAHWPKNVVCKTFKKPRRRRCATTGRPVDGAKINPPPRRIP